MKVVIIDDEKAARLEIGYFLKLHYTSLEIIEYSNGTSFLKDILLLDFEVVFVDIHLQDMFGIDLVRQINEIKPNCIIVFISAYDKYAIDAYQLGVFEYLTKPLIKDRFALMIDRINQQLDSSNSHSIVVTYKNTMNVINLSDIVYIEHLERKSLIYTKDNVYYTLSSLKAIEQEVNSNTFFRAHQSYLVNLDYLYQINKYSVNQYYLEMKYYPENVILLSRHKYKDLKEYLNNTK